MKPRAYVLCFQHYCSLMMCISSWVAEGTFILICLHCAALLPKVVKGELVHRMPLIDFQAYLSVKYIPQVHLLSFPSLVRFLLPLIGCLPSINRSAVHHSFFDIYLSLAGV